MDFARKQLEKYGWSDGKGLGKNENGISQALRPKIKRSVTGVGHDPAADFTEHWWSALYNKAANNIEIQEKNGKTKKLKAKADDFQITNNSYHLKRKSNKSSTNGEYSEFFIKTAVLDGVKVANVEKLESEEDEDTACDMGGTEKKDVHKMTDEELFAACEGRTAHKGARHGLKALGKLARIEKQEQLLLEQPQYNGYSHAEQLKKKRKYKGDEHINVNELDEKVSSDDALVKIKKKKTNKIDETKNVFDDRHELNCEESIVKTKKKKNKSAKTDLAETTNVFDERKMLEGEESNCNESTAKTKKKKSKSYVTDDESFNSWKMENEIDEIIDANSLESVGIAKKKKGKYNDTSNSCKNEGEETGMMKQKKLKKKSFCGDDEIIESVNIIDESTVAHKKKKKRKHCLDNR